MEIRGLDSRQAWDYENGFYWFTGPDRLHKLLAHYEIYKMVTGIPGDVLELGVFKGLSLLRWATFRQALEVDHSRKIIGFDAFGAFPREKVSGPDDIKFIERFENDAGDGLKKEEVAKIIRNKGFANIELCEGDILTTLPAYLEMNPQLRIALLHLDMDVEKPTELALSLLFERLVPNGVIVIDDYNAVAGATKAVDAFLRENKLSLRKLPFYSVPSFTVKTS